MDTKKILVVTPYGGLHGSELYIKNLLEHADKPATTIKVFVNAYSDKKYDDSRYIYSPLKLSNRWHRIIDKCFRFVTGLSYNEYRVLKLHKKLKPDLWYINTIVIPNFAKLAITKKIPYILHVHELPSVYSQMKGYLLQAVIENAKAVIVCSQKQEQIFKNMGAVSTLVLPGAIRKGINPISKMEKIHLRNKFNIPSDATVFGACASTSYHKGFDLFILMAMSIKKPNVYFVWAGKIKDHGFEQVYLKMAENNPNIIFTGEFDFNSTRKVFGLFDYFILSSREDSYPLVMIEAAAMGLPILSFESGGVEEFLEHDMGCMTEGINPKAMVRNIYDIIDGKKEFNRSKLISKAQKHDVNSQIKMWNEFINNL